MESTPVNWEALDTVVIEFAKLENLIEDSSSSPSPSPSSSPSSSSYHSRLIIRQIRRFLETGAIDAAVNLLHLHAPSFLFRLHKQKFVELLRKGTSEDCSCSRCDYVIPLPHKPFSQSPVIMWSRRVW